MMANVGWDIDGIVREVLRRLDDLETAERNEILREHPSAAERS